MTYNVHIQMIMFSSKISKNSRKNILHNSSILFYPWQRLEKIQHTGFPVLLDSVISLEYFVAGARVCWKVGFRMLLDSVFSLEYYFAGARVCRKDSTFAFGCAMTPFFLRCTVLFCGCQGLKKRQHVGFPVLLGQVYRKPTGPVSYVPPTGGCNHLQNNDNKEGLV